MNEFKIIKIKFFILLIISLIFGCGSGDSSSSNDSSTERMIASMDITDATHLLILPSSLSPSKSASYSEPSENKLYKFTEDGVILEVTYKDSSGNIITDTLSPTDILEAGSNYTVICFGGSPGFECRNGLLTRKSDGAAFSLGDFSIAQSQIYINTGEIQTDCSNNMYFIHMVAPNNIYKIDASNPEALTAEKVTPDEEGVSYWAVDCEGNIIFKSFFDTNDYTRIRKENGGLYPLSNDINFFWVGIDKNIYFHEFMHESLQDVIYKANITDSGTVSIEKVDDGSVGELSFGSRSIYRYEFDDSTIFIAYLAVYKMDSSNNIPTKISLPIVGGIILSTSSDNYYFIYGEDESSDYVLLKVNPKDDTYTSTDTSGYDLYSLSTNQNDELVFYGLRHADSKKVFAQIEIDGSISIIEEISNNEIIVLERIR